MTVSGRPRLAALLSALLPLTPCCAAPAFAQDAPPWLSGYFLTVPLWSEAGPFGAGGFGSAHRLRFMADPSFGPVAAELAYEQFINWRATAGGGLGLGVPGAIAPGGGEWLDLQWTIEDDENVRWTHRFDRLNVSVAAGETVTATVGRQAISWATTLILTPADPFALFDPADPFKEYRGGVDAARVQVYPGPLSTVEVVVRPASFPLEETLSVLGRYAGVLASWELSGYAGVLYDRPAVGLGAAGGAGRAAVRGEFQLQDTPDELVFRGTVGLDTRFDLSGRDLYVVFQYQHDGFGASSADELEEVVVSSAFSRGELQVLSADVAVWQGAYQLHPLLSTQLLVLWSLNDLSAMFAPGVSYSVSQEATAQGGVFVGVGDAQPALGDPLPSEFGVVPTTVYASISLFL